MRIAILDTIHARPLYNSVNTFWIAPQHIACPDTSSAPDLDAIVRGKRRSAPVAVHFREGGVPFLSELEISGGFGVLLFRRRVNSDIVVAACDQRPNLFRKKFQLFYFSRNRYYYILPADCFGEAALSDHEKGVPNVASYNGDGNNRRFQSEGSDRLLCVGTDRTACHADVYKVFTRN